MVAGLTDITEGGIILDGKEIATPAPTAAVVFQSPSPGALADARTRTWRSASTACIPHATPRERRDMVRLLPGRVSASATR